MDTSEIINAETWVFIIVLDYYYAIIIIKKIKTDIFYSFLSLGNFQYLGDLGHGGMGDVYKAREHDSGNILAIKVINISTKFEEDNFLKEINIHKQLK